MIVPEHLKSEPYLVLQYGYDLPIPISDLEVDEHGVRATLSFSKQPQRTVVPWSAVYVVTCDDGRCVLYQEDVPEDVSIIATHPRPDRVSDESDIEALAEEAADAQAEEASDDVPAAEVESAAEGNAQRTAVGSSRRSAVPGTTGPSGRISERLLRSVPHDEAVSEAEAPPSSRRRRKPQLRLVK